MKIFTFLKQKIFGKEPETVADRYYKKMGAKIVWDYTGKPTGIKGIERLGEQLKEISKSS